MHGLVRVYSNAKYLWANWPAKHKTNGPISRSMGHDACQTKHETCLLKTDKMII